jgi:hypothetical protein
MHWKTDGSGCKLLLLQLRNEKGARLVEGVEVREGDEVIGILSLSLLENQPVESEPNLHDGRKVQIPLECSLRDQMG